jgi:hypothetical protein
VTMMRMGLLAAAACFASGVAHADNAPAPAMAKQQADVATLLFGNPQWSKAPAGSTITYSYSKKTGTATLGSGFDDHISLTLAAGEDADSRAAEVKMFSGANAKAAGPFPSAKQNPVLLLVMEENVQELSKLFKANPRYLKNAIRKAWRDDPKIVGTNVDVDGKSVPGTKISVTPFLDDPEKDKMMGLNALTYTVKIADSVPGSIAEIDIETPPGAKASFSETLKFQEAKG